MTEIVAILAKVPLRWWIYVACASVLGYVLWHDHSITRRYNDEHQRSIALESRVGELQHAAEVDRRVAAELATFRLQQHADFKAFDEKVQAAKITREVHYVTAKGDQGVCVERDRGEYRRLYNEAVSGAAPATAVLPGSVPGQ